MTGKSCKKKYLQSTDIFHNKIIICVMFSFSHQPLSLAVRTARRPGFNKQRLSVQEMIENVFGMIGSLLGQNRLLYVHYVCLSN